MSIDLYASLCGVELWNRQRTGCYVSSGLGGNVSGLRGRGCEALQDLIPCAEHRPPDANGYFMPEVDPAPWYDPRIPESGNFAGLLVMETKLSPALDRRLVQGLGHGAVATRARMQGRTLYVRGLLLGRTCCGVSYGLRWLAQAMLGAQCDPCTDCELTYLSCCPSMSSDMSCITVCEDDRLVPYFSTATEWQRGADFIRSMEGVTLLSGPEVLSCRGGGCGCGCSTTVEVEFTMGVTNPWLYREEEVAIEATSLACSGDFYLRWDDSGGCDPGSPCSPAGDCADDPDCAPQPPPPFTQPQAGCGCVPLLAGRTGFQLDGQYDWFEQVLIVEVEAGSAPLRNLAVRAWPNPLGLDPSDPANADYFADCYACSTLLVSYVPPTGRLVFDSKRRKVEIECANTVRPAGRNVTQANGMPFDWLVMGCQPLAVVIEADCANTAEDATVTISRAGREL